MIHRPLEKQDIELLRSWRNKHMKYLRQWHLLSGVDQEQWFLNHKGHLFYVVQREHGECGLQKWIEDIGVFGLTYIDWQNRKCELSFIGEYYLPSRDYDDNCEFLNTALNVAFNDFNMNRVWVEIYDFDEGKHELLIDYGFQEEGRLRKTYLHKGKYYDSIIFGLLSDEWGMK